MSKVQVRSESQELSYLDPFATFLRLQEIWGETGVALLESLSGPLRETRESLIAFGPLLTLSLTNLSLELTGREQIVRFASTCLEASGAVERDDHGRHRLHTESDLWRALRAISSAFECPDASPTSFRFGFVGYLGYDVVRSIERLPYRIEAGSDRPTVVLTLFEGLVSFDLVNRRTTLSTSSARPLWTSRGPAPIAQGLAEGRAAGFSAIDAAPEVPAPRAVRPTMKRKQYLDRVEKAFHYIRIGDIYQVQLGHEIDVETAAAPLDVFRRLRIRNPSPYMYLMPMAGHTLVGASPESFIRVEDRRIVVRPIAGTVKRGATPDENARLIERLRADEKEIAEHLMLVDLCRNDVGRVCKPGTLEATDLFVVEQYSHVNHLVSSIAGDLRSGVDSFDAIAATFPAGTMTGAPKIRAMEIIEELEMSRRGAYAGAVGLIDFAGYVNMALCIRSTVHYGDRYVLRASAGVVADSVADGEWRETLQKMAVTYWAVAGEELTYEGLPD